MANIEPSQAATGSGAFDETNVCSIPLTVFEIDLRFNRALDEKAQKYLNHFQDDEEIGLLRWRGDDEHVVLTFLVKHPDRKEALQRVSRQAAVVWPHEVPDGVGEVR
jgi:hypothetical protein